MQLEDFTVVLTLRHGNAIEQSTHVIAAPSEKEAVRAAFNYASQDYPNAKAANEVVLMGQVVFHGALTPLDAFKEDPFDFEGQANEVTDDEHELFRAVVSGHSAKELAIMPCWLDREPTWALVAVRADDDGEEVDIDPLYLRLTDNLRSRMRAPNGDPLEYEEDEKPVDPSLH